MSTTTLLSCALLCCAGNMSYGADMDDSAKHDNFTVTDTHKAETAKHDQEFINTVISGGMLEIQASRLALSQSGLPANVTDAAHAMVDDHTKLDDTLSSIATAKGYSVPTTLEKDDVRKLEKLQEENGKGLDFLRAYDSFLVKTHKNAISLFEDTSKDTKDVDLKSFTIDSLPKLHKHADMVAQLPYAKEENEWWKFW